MLIVREKPAAHRLNAGLSVVFALVGVWTLWLLPIVLPRWPFAAWSLVAVVFVTTTWWSLIHETIHGLLFRNRRLNDAAGRLLAVLFLLPFRPVAFGHLFHHRRNRSDLDRAEFYPRGASKTAAALAYYARLLGGLYFAECAVSLAVWLPHAWLRRLAPRRFLEAGLVSDARLLENTLLQPRSLWATRLDSACILLSLGVSVWFYGNHAWMLILALLGRGLLLSLMDNAYHYATPLDAPRYALNLGLPRPLSSAILHFNLHRIHHLHPAAPWYHLPALYRAAHDQPDGGYLALALRQLRGPLRLDR